MQAVSLDRATLYPADTVLFWNTITRPLQLIVSFEFLFVMFVFGGVFKANPAFTGLFPIDSTLFFGAASLAVGIPIMLRNGIFRPSVIPILLYVVLCSWIVLSIFWTEAEELAPIFQHLMRIVLLNGWVLIGTCGIVAANRRRTSRFLALVVVLAVIAAVDWIVNAGSLSHAGFLENRSYQNTARLVAAGFIVLFGILMFGRVAWIGWLTTAAGVVLFFYALLIMGARAPLIGLILGALVMLVMAISVTDRQILVRTGTLSALVMALGLITYIVFLLQSGVETWTMRRLQGLFRFFTSLGVTGDGSAEARAYYVHAALLYWTDSWKTIFFGNGILSFTYLYAGIYIPGTNPHNIPLEVLSEFGLIGFGLFVAFVMSLLMQVSFKVRPGESWAPVVIALCVSVMFFSVTSGDMLNFFYFLVYSGLLPAIGAARRP